jgi:hypothetical protein
MNDIDVVIEAFGSAMYLLGCIIKYINFIINESKVKI